MSRELIPTNEQKAGALEQLGRDIDTVRRLQLELGQRIPASKYITDMIRLDELNPRVHAALYCAVSYQTGYTGLAFGEAEVIYDPVETLVMLACFEEAVHDPDTTVMLPGCKLLETQDKELSGDVSYRKADLGFWQLCGDDKWELHVRNIRRGLWSAEEVKRMLNENPGNIQYIPIIGNEAVTVYQQCAAVRQ